METFFKNFVFGDEGYLCIAEKRPSNVRLLSLEELDHYETPEGIDVFFGPALRKTNESAEKNGVLGTRALWADIDDPTVPQTVLEPSMVVRSGFGSHLYWFLEEPILDVPTIEALNKGIERSIPTADVGIWNANRVLRVPGTINSKRGEAAVTLLTKSNSVYTRSDITVLGELGSETKRKTIHKINTGDRRGYKSRSERDWAVVRGLVAAGASDGLIVQIFDRSKIGDKHRDPNTPDGYLEHTIERARESKPERKQHREPPGITEREDGYYMVGRSTRRISSFTIEPEILLDGTEQGGEDAIVGTICADEYEWPGVTLTRSAFTTSNRMDNETPLAAWQWMGNDGDVRQLLPYLLEKLKERGLPRVIATPQLGLFGPVKSQDDDGKRSYCFVGDSGILTADKYFEGHTGPVAWIPSKKEHPTLALERLTQYGSKAKQLLTLLPSVNEKEVFWPMLGWYAASPLKPWLENTGIRFPILHVTGTRGSGKTTLIQRLFMPLFGQKEPKSYDSGTTRFVTLALLGSSNAVPIAFSEFRYAQVEKFLRYILLAYDTGHDARGRADQTTVDYPLSAPFSVDGEDLIVDPAAQQRMVVARLDPRIVQEGEIADETFNRISSEWDALKGVGGAYIQHVLGLLDSGEAERILARSRSAFFDAYPKRLPIRVRNNHIVAYFGCCLWGHFLGQSPPPPQVMDRSIRAVYNIEAGRARTLADEFVEDIVNACVSTTQRFQWRGTGSSISFQLASAHNYWLGVRRGRGKGGLERDAILSQLKEADYYKGHSLESGMIMHEIDLQKAQEQGLDIPNVINVNQVTLNLKEK